MLGLVPLADALATRAMERSIAQFDATQAALRTRYRLDHDTPVTGWSRQAEAQAAHARASGAAVATTSGSTGDPKRVAMTRARLRSFKRGSASAGVRTWARLGIPSPALFVLANLDDDDSFSSLVLRNERAWPGWLHGLVEPARYLSAPAVQALLAEHGATATRAWLMALSDPGVLYATNPSTLAVFFARLVDDERVAGLARAVPPARVVKRVAAPGHLQRLEALAAKPGDVASWMPSLRAWCSWDGGYVAPYVDQVRRHLPPERFTHVPMFSMSTETVETLTVFDGSQPRFLPLAPGVYYEFLPEEAPDAPEHLLGPRELQQGRTYTLVASDGYGLRRYQTEDLFHCAGHLHGLPDLRFRRRRGLSFSFTGEKLTGEQVTAAFDAARRDHDLDDLQLALFPSWPDHAATPSYRLVFAHTSKAPARDLAPVVDTVLRRLREQNSELAAKLDSGRLRPLEPRVMAYDELAAQLDHRAGGWESQFKLAPLYTRTWQTLGLP